MMKTRIHTLLPAALLLLATACEDTLTAPGNPATGNGPTLTLALDNREDNGQTRSKLTDGAPVNHVQSVRILVFKGTGDNATYEGEEIYTGDNEGAITWPEPEGDQEKPNKIPYQMNYPFVEDETYTLLGVGQDEQFATTYDLIDNNDKNDIEQGTTLTNAYAKLKENASPKECDFYTGTTTFTYEGRDTHIDDLRMKRRVAGVLLYVTEIPQSLTDENNNNYRITSIRVCLGEIVNQNSSVRLQRDFENWNEEPAGQTTLANSNVIAEITGLENWTWTAENADFYMKDGKPATARTGVYMLPLNATEDKPTFTVKMYGKKLSSDATGGATEGEEKELKSFTVEQRDTDGESVTSFPIRSNYLYSIGKYNPEEGVDEPISLSGDPIYLEVLPFQPLDVSHDFGEARVQALFNPDFDEKYIFNCMNTTFDVEILPPLTTIRDRVKSITITIIPENTHALEDENGTDVLIKDDTKLTEQAKSYYQQWLYIKNGSTYSKTYSLYTNTSGSSIADMPKKITFFMQDYARFRMWGWKEASTLQNGEYAWEGGADNINRINADIRYIDVILTTTIGEDTDGNGIIDEGEPTFDRTDQMRIKQYNTITVYYRNMGDDDLKEYTARCGFSREDLYKDGERLQNAWGYQNSYNYGVYTSGCGVNYRTGSLYNGSLNAKAIGYLDPNVGSWNGCVGGGVGVYPLYNQNQLTPTITLPITSKNQKTDKCWYLPAKLELLGFFTQCASNENGISIHHNLLNNEKYWTSTLENSDTKWGALVYQLTENGPTNDEYLERSVNNKCYIRQARRFPDDNDYNYQW